MAAEPIKEDVYEFLRDMPCLLCEEPEAYVVGSFVPERPSHYQNRQKKAPMLYYALCKRCFNHGRIQTSRIESVYRQKMANWRMDTNRQEPNPKRVTMI
jgi:hypothetical protein